MPHKIIQTSTINHGNLTKVKHVSLITSEKAFCLGVMTTASIIFCY